MYSVLKTTNNLSGTSSNSGRGKYQIYGLELSMDQITVNTYSKEQPLKVRVKLLEFAEVLADYELLYPEIEETLSSESDQTEFSDSENSSEASQSKGEQSSPGTLEPSVNKSEDNRSNRTASIKNSESKVENESKLKTESEIDNDERSTIEGSGDSADKEELTPSTSTIEVFSGQIVRSNLSVLILKRPIELINLMQRFLIEIKLELADEFVSFPVGKAKLQMGPTFWELVCLSQTGNYRTMISEQFVNIVSDNGRDAGSVRATLKLSSYCDKSFTEFEWAELPAATLSIGDEDEDEECEDEEMGEEEELEDEDDWGSLDDDDDDDPESDESEPEQEQVLIDFECEEGEPEQDEECECEEEEEDLNLNTVTKLKEEFDIEGTRIEILETYLEISKRETGTHNLYTLQDL